MQNKTLQTKRVLRTALLILLLSAAGLGKMVAQDFTVGDLNYSINNDGTSVTVTGHVDGTSAIGWLTIPEMVSYNGKEYPVVSIGDKAFYECQGLTALIIGDSVTTIGFRAFGRCTGFTGPLYIPDGVTRIGTGAFASCGGFTGPLIIPESVKQIGSAAFAWCSGFTGSLIIPESVASIGASAFMKCSGFTGTLVIPESLTNIPYWAFFGCSGLTGPLNLPNSLTYIDEKAFCECSGLTGPLNLPNSLSYIGERAFCECSGLTGSLNLPNILDSIGDYAFYKCSGLTGPLNLPNNLTSIGIGTFAYCSGLTGELILPDSITEIKEGSFYNCSNLTGNLVIGNQVTSIGVGAFGYCSGFSGSLTIPNAVCKIDEGSFYGCNGFSGSLTLPNVLGSIGDYAFADCSNFNSIIALGTVPPVIEINSFSGFGSPELIVRCGYSETYHASDWANFFTTIIEDCNTYSISIEESGWGIVNTSVNNAQRGDEIVVSYLPNTGYGMSLIKAFKTDDESQTISLYNLSNSEYGFIMPPFNVTISGIFVPIVYSVSIDPSITNGSVNPSVNEAVMGDTVSLDVKPDIGYELQSLIVYNVDDYTQMVEVIDNYFIMSYYDVLVSANFVPVMYSIDINSNITDGSVSASANRAVMGETISLDVKPNLGCELLSLSVHNVNDTTQIVNVTHNSFVMPAFDVIVSAIFVYTSVDENASVFASIYPNPTNGKVTIEAENLKHITISNLLGQTIYDGNAGGDVFEYDFSKHKTGIYLIRVETSSGVAVKKVSVTR